MPAPPTLFETRVPNSDLPPPMVVTSDGIDRLVRTIAWKNEKCITGARRTPLP